MAWTGVTLNRDEGEDEHNNRERDEYRRKESGEWRRIRKTSMGEWEWERVRGRTWGGK